MIVVVHLRVERTDLVGMTGMVRVGAIICLDLGIYLSEKIADGVPLSHRIVGHKEAFLGDFTILEGWTEK